MRFAGLWLALMLFSGPVAAQDRLRIATFNTELKRDGPGLLLRDISRGKDAQLAAVVEVITAVSPDILVVQGIDWDYDTRALEAFAKALEAAGAPYPHLFSPELPMMTLSVMVTSPRYASTPPAPSAELLPEIRLPAMSISSLAAIAPPSSPETLFANLLFDTSISPWT